jgi:hypothetical protein
LENAGLTNIKTLEPGIILLCGRRTMMTILAEIGETDQAVPIGLLTSLSKARVLCPENVAGFGMSAALVTAPGTESYQNIHACLLCQEFIKPDLFTIYCPINNPLGVLDSKATA